MSEKIKSILPSEPIEKRRACLGAQLTVKHVDKIKSTAPADAIIECTVNRPQRHRGIYGRSQSLDGARTPGHNTQIRITGGRKI